jgi:ABC-type amino acid transport substrate-binding protein
VASEEFKVGAAAQAKALGLDPAIVWVPHPIQNRLPEELAAIADAAIAPILARISRPPASR